MTIKYKALVTLLMSVFFSNYSGANIDTYDPVSGLYYKGIAYETTHRATHEPIKKNANISRNLPLLERRRLERAQDKANRTAIPSYETFKETRVSNICVFDPKTEKTHSVFFDNKKRRISRLIFETHACSGLIDFYDSFHVDFTNPLYAIKNNTDIEKRELKNKLLIEVQVGNETALWVCDRQGHNAKKLAIIPANASWHIDVKNSKIRVFSTASGGLRVTNYDW